MNDWIVELYVWPYSSIKRGERVDYLDESEQKSRGQRNPVVQVRAENFADAVKAANNIIDGVMLDERVWQAGICGVRKKGVRDA